MVNEILIQVFSSLEEQERKQMLKRQSEGNRRAKERGVKFGRPRKVDINDPEDVTIIRKALKKKISVSEAARQLGITRPYFYQIKDKYLSKLEKSD